jgi:hypothetical protein
VDPGPAQHDPQFQWRVAQNLYTSPQDEPGTPLSQLLLIAAAVGETLRFLGPPADAVAALGVTPDEWMAYRADVIATHGPWVDAEVVAVRCCGYMAQPGDLATWRAPIRATEAAVRTLLPDMAHPVLRRWLAVECGCGPEYVGLRYPPAFTCLLADVFTDQVRRNTAATPLVATVAAGDGPHPHQVYSVWLRFGFATIPDAERLTRTWDTTDHFALERAGGRLTAEVLARHLTRQSPEGW